MDFFPDYCMTKIQNIDYFKIDLPVTAFGYPDSMIITLSVELGKSDDGKQYRANVWASLKDAKVKHFIFRTSIPVCAEPEQAIVEALNGDIKFHDYMCGYIEEAAKHRFDK